jgi:hypothetical protein
MGMFEDSLDECMAETQRLMRERKITYEEARKIVADENVARSRKPFITQDGNKI